MEKEPYPAWAENATKGDLVLALIKLRYLTANLARAVIALKAGNDEQFQSAMNDYFDRSEDAGTYTDEVGGGARGE